MKQREISIILLVGVVLVNNHDCVLTQWISSKAGRAWHRVEPSLQTSVVMATPYIYIRKWNQGNTHTIQLHTSETSVVMATPYIYIRKWNQGNTHI